jgi:hypothetical protein
MRTVTWGLLAGVILAGGAVGLANPAAAEPLSGTYTADFGSGTVQTWVLNPCGPDCLRLDVGGPVRELHLQGNTWTVSDDIDGDGISCLWSIDNTSLAAVTGCGGMTFPGQLTKTG